MAKQTITRRQKDVSRLLRERKEAYPQKLKAARRGEIKVKWR
jgi:hypothetical protein